MFKSHSDSKYYLKGFQLLGQKLNHSSELDILMGEKDVTLLKLQNKLSELSQLAALERKENKNESFLAWGLIVTTVFTSILSNNVSSFFYFLSIPIVIISIAYLLFVFPNYQNTLSESLKICFYKLMFQYDVGMSDYIEGRKKITMKTPVYSYLFMEKRLKFKIKQIQNINHTL